MEERLSMLAAASVWYRLLQFLAKPEKQFREPYSPIIPTTYHQHPRVSTFPILHVMLLSIFSQAPAYFRFVIHGLQLEKWLRGGQGDFVV